VIRWILPPTRIAARYDPPIAAGEALFSAAEAALLDRYAGLRRARDILLFDPVYCYGLPGYLQIIDTLTATGWPRQAFRPHGGHLFSLHLVAALGLGGAEINPLAFHPFHGPPPALPVNADRMRFPSAPVLGRQSSWLLTKWHGQGHAVLTALDPVRGQMSARFRRARGRHALDRSIKVTSSGNHLPQRG